MLEIFSNIIAITGLVIVFNVMIKDYFDKITKYSDLEFHWMPTPFILCFIFFGFIMIFFYKYFKEYRKRIYMENYIRHVDFYKITLPSLYKDHEDKYNNYKIYLKLKKIKRKSKKK